MLIAISFLGLAYGYYDSYDSGAGSGMWHETTGHQMEDCVKHDPTEGNCDIMTIYCNGWCEEPWMCPEGSSEECMWRMTTNTYECECIDDKCPEHMVKFMDWRTNTPKCVEGHEIEIVSEFAATQDCTTNYWCEYDCGQGRDEWGNLKWDVVSPLASYDWGKQLCVEKKGCGEGFFKQWGQQGEFCMSRGHPMKCPPEQMLVNYWDPETYQESIHCVAALDRKPMQKETTFHYHPGHEPENKKHHNEMVDHALDMSDTTVNHHHTEYKSEAVAASHHESFDDSYAHADGTMEEHLHEPSNFEDSHWDSFDHSHWDSFEDSHYDSSHYDSWDMSHHDDSHWDSFDHSWDMSHQEASNYYGSGSGMWHETTYSDSYGSGSGSGMSTYDSFEHSHSWAMSHHEPSHYDSFEHSHSWDMSHHEPSHYEESHYDSSWEDSSFDDTMASGSAWGNWSW